MLPPTFCVHQQMSPSQDRPQPDNLFASRVESGRLRQQLLVQQQLVLDDDVGVDYQLGKNAWHSHDDVLEAWVRTAAGQQEGRTA